MSTPGIELKLLRLSWEEWEVLALCEPGGRCPALDVLIAAESSSPAAAEAALGILMLLRHGVPADGPPHGDAARPLGLGLYELRRRLRGENLRVVWFHGGARRVVCALAMGPAERAPQVRIEEARVRRRQYFAAKGANRLSVVDLEDPEAAAGVSGVAAYSALFARAEASVDYWSELAALELAWHVERPFESGGGLFGGDGEAGRQALAAGEGGELAEDGDRQFDPGQGDEGQDGWT